MAGRAGAPTYAANRRADKAPFLPSGGSLGYIAGGCELWSSRAFAMESIPAEKSTDGPIPWDRPNTTREQLRRWQRHVRFARQGWVAEGLEAIKTQRQLLSQETGPESQLPLTGLLPYRRFFTQIQDHSASIAVRLYLQWCSEEMVPLALWLLSRHACRFNLCGLPDYVGSNDPRVQRILARAFARCEAWEQLARLESRAGRSAEATRFAAAAERRCAFARRLSNWNRHVRQQPLAESLSQKALWFRDWPWSLTPPKSAAAIRRVLRRIHWLVRRHA